MSKFILFTFAFLTGFAHAASPIIANERVMDGDIAEIRVKVTDVGESANPLSVEVSILCIDKRASKTPTVPKWTYIVDRTVCAWGGKEYDTATKELTLQVSVAKLMVGDTPCEPLPAKTFDLKKYCARWNK